MSTSNTDPAPAYIPDTDAPMTGDLVGNGYPNAQMQDVLDMLQELGPEPMENLTPEEAREQPTPADAVMALLTERGDSPAPQPIADVDDFRVLTPEGEIPVRVYTPDGHGPFPVVVYAHGGGWVIADVQTYDASCRALANAVPCVVVSVDYRRAPEHPFPTAVEDVYAVYRWALNNAMEINGDPGRVAIAGESAGGNMAAVVCQMAKADQVPLPLHQVLVYPVTDFSFDTHSYAEHADAKPLNADMMRWFANHYLPNAGDRTDWRAAPLRGDLHGLPPATIILAEIDPLRSDGEAYLEALRAAGVDARGTLYHGVTHEFFGMTAVLDAARDAVAEAAGDLRTAFQQAHPEADTAMAASAAMGGAGAGAISADAMASQGVDPAMEMETERPVGTDTGAPRVADSDATLGTGAGAVADAEHSLTTDPLTDTYTAFGSDVAAGTVGTYAADGPEFGDADERASDNPVDTGLPTHSGWDSHTATEFPRGGEPPSEAAASADAVTRDTLRADQTAGTYTTAQTEEARHASIAPDRGKATNTFTDVDMGTRRQTDVASAGDASVDLSGGSDSEVRDATRFEADMHKGTLSLDDPGTEHSLGTTDRDADIPATGIAGEMDMDMAERDASGATVDMSDRGLGASLQQGIAGAQTGGTGSATPPRTGDMSAGVPEPQVDQGSGVGVGRDANQDPGMQPNVNADMDMGITSDAAAGGGSTQMARADQRMANEVDRSIGMEVETPHAMGAVSGNDTATDYLRESMADSGFNPTKDEPRRSRDDAYTGDRRPGSNDRDRDVEDGTYPDPDDEANPLRREPAASDPAIDPTRGDDDLPEQPGVEPDPNQQNAAANVNIGDLVLGADANPVGRVVDIRPDGIVVDRDAQPSVLVPLDAVSRAEAGQAVLYMPANDVSGMHWNQGQS